MRGVRVDRKGVRIKAGTKGKGQGRAIGTKGGRGVAGAGGHRRGGGAREWGGGQGLGVGTVRPTIAKSDSGVTRTDDSDR